MIAAAMAGCSVATTSFNNASATGGAIVGSLGAPVTPAVVPAPPSPAMGAFLEGPVGSRLGNADRDKAYQAELDALAANDRTTWRGTNGNFGFVALTGSEGPDGCHPFTHTIYIGGRPQTGKGTGCKGPDGTWRVTG